jgi:hypothetical protein
MLSSLIVIPESKVRLHEAHEESRLEKIKAAILAEGYLRHPILVTKMKEDKYLVIDGAHRFQALRSIGCTKIPVQVISPEKITLSTWEHDVEKGLWLEKLKLESIWEKQNKLKKTEWTAALLDENGVEYWLVPIKQPTNLNDRLRNWHQLVNTYINTAFVYRLPLNNDGLPLKGRIRFRFPTWTIADIENVVTDGKVLPAGTTQFILEERMLNLRIPLYLLTTPLECTNEWDKLKQFWSSSLRYYPGGVYLNEV